MIYLDHAATTPDKTHPYIEVPICSAWDGNPHSPHDAGLSANKILRNAAWCIKQHINGHDGEIIWTPSGSIANSVAIQTICAADELVASDLEHKSITQWFSSYLCYDSDYVLESGVVDLKMMMEGHVRPWTRLVCLQLVNNETGIIQPVNTLGVLIKDHEALFHVDAVQGLGKMPIDVEDIGCDMMSLSAHKIYGPKGIGCLWVRREVYDRYRNEWPYLGTPSPELIDRFAHAVNELDPYTYHKLQKQREEWFFNCLELAEGIDYFLNTGRQGKIPGLVSLAFPGIDNDELMMVLSEQGVMVSTGSACNHDPVPSAVLRAMSIPDDRIASTIRISMGCAVSRDTLLTAAGIISQTVKELQSGS